MKGKCFLWERHLAAKKAALGQPDRGKMPLPHKTNSLFRFLGVFSLLPEKLPPYL